MKRIPQALESPHEPAPVTLAERRAARRKWFGRGPKERAYLGRHVYVVDVLEWGGLVKIGSAFDVEMRFRQLQACSPLKLGILGYVDRGGVKLERALHDRFKAQRSHGEWFTVCRSEVEAAIAEMGHRLIRVSL